MNLTKASSSEVAEKVRVEQIEAETAKEINDPDIAIERNNTVTSLDNRNSLHELRHLEERAIRKFSNDKNFFFHRNVKLNDGPRFIIDALHEDQKKISIIEVKYSKSGFFPKSLIRNTISQIDSVRNYVSSKFNKYFSATIIFIIDAENDKNDKALSVIYDVKQIASEFGLDVGVEVYYRHELEATET